MSNLPTSWAICNLGDVIEMRTGPFGSALHKHDYVSNGIPVINPTHIKNACIEPDYSVSISEDKATALSEYKLYPNDVIMGRRGEMGRCAVVPDYANGWICGTGSVILKTSAALDANYLQRYLSSPSTVRSLEGESVGSTMVNLNQKILLGLSIGIPPLQEQRRIAHKLDTTLARVDALNNRLARITPLLKRFRQSVLAAATSGRLTEDWRVSSQAENEWLSVSLKEVASDFSYGSSAKSAKSGKVPVLRMGNIQDGALDWTDLVYTSDPEEIEKYKLEKGDVLFNRTNSPELVGKTAIFQGEQEAIYAGYLIRVKCSEKLIPEYLNYCLGSPMGREYCWQVKSDGVSQSNINAKKLAAFEFLLPPIEEQTEIVRRVETLFAFADRLETRLQFAQTAAERLTPALLAKAFRGELVPQDPSDEPAAELLRRLREARAADTTSKPKRGRAAKAKAVTE